MVPAWLAPAIKTPSGTWNETLTPLGLKIHRGVLAKHQNFKYNIARQSSYMEIKHAMAFGRGKKSF